MTLIVLCAALLAGLAVGVVARLDGLALGFGAGLALAAAGLSWRQPRPRLLALATCAAALGGLRAMQVPAVDDQAAFEPYLGQTVRLSGEVVQAPSVGQRAVQFQVAVQALGLPGREPPPLERSAGVRPPLVRVVGDAAALGSVPAPNAPLDLQGRLVAEDGPRRPPTLLFPSLVDRATPATPGALGPNAGQQSPPAMLAGLRSAADGNIRRWLPAPQAALAAGVLLGGSVGLDADFRWQLQRSGLSHLVAIDGYKLTVVSAALGAVAVRLLGPRLASLPIGLGLVGYTLLTGAHPSAIRAALMVGLALVASLSGRVADPLTSVLLAAALMAGAEPRILLDTGLQLSLSATLGIVLLWPRWRARLRCLPRFVAEPVGLTLAVTLATLPVTLSVFDVVSLVSPLAHVLAVPLLAPILVSSCLLALVSPIPSLGVLAAWLTWLPTTLLLEVVHVCGSLPAAALSTGRLPPLVAGGLAAAVLTWGLLGLPEAAPVHRAWAIGRMRVAAWWRPLLALGTCLAAISVLALVRPDGRLHVYPLLAGRGQAVLIRGPTGRTTLVASGHLDGVLLTTQVAEHLALWEHKLDGVLPLDGAAQASLGPTLQRYPPTRQLTAADAERFDLGGGAALDVYAPIARSNPSGASISFGRVWLPLAGHPPAPALDDRQTPSQAAPLVDLVSDGDAVWLANDLGFAPNV